MKKIGLTGGMGAGKSAVASFLSRKGLCCIDADEVSRAMLQPGCTGWDILKRDLGPKFFKADMTIDRPYLRQAIFSDNLLREKINSLLHPLIRNEIFSEVAKKSDGSELSQGGKTSGLVIIEVPLLYEAGWEDDFDQVVVVYADHDQCVARVMQRDGGSRGEVERSLVAQWPLQDKVERADHVIDNSRCWSNTSLQVLHLMKLLSV
ncbi:MAG: dephospho-CoA kinase [Proteobacteria bacterium]|nr:dephospho-CoA kinase [Pseudomonadota bacterium]MBU1714552.1 dephospho-CoA kinase [Pseudomonadota bacterium]